MSSKYRLLILPAKKTTNRFGGLVDAPVASAQGKLPELISQLHKWLPLQNDNCLHDVPEGWLISKSKPEHFYEKAFSLAGYIHRCLGDLTAYAYNVRLEVQQGEQHYIFLATELGVTDITDFVA